MAVKPYMQVVSSVAEVHEFVKEVQRARFYDGKNEMYRGQERDGEWFLKPNLARKLTDVDEAQEKELAMLVEFDERLKTGGLEIHIRRKFLNRQFHSEWLLIQQAQHLELPTRFMDWSARWQVALYFAVAHPEHDPFDGQVWIYRVPHDMFFADGNDERVLYLDENPFTTGRTMFLNPSGFWDGEARQKLGERRRSRQHGRFMIQPYSDIFLPMEENPLHQPNLIKLVIPAAAKEKIRADLAEEGYDHEGMFLEQNDAIAAIVNDLRSKYGV